MLAKSLKQMSWLTVWALFGLVMAAEGTRAEPIPALRTAPTPFPRPAAAANVTALTHRASAPLRMDHHNGGRTAFVSMRIGRPYYYAYSYGYPYYYRPRYYSYGLYGYGYYRYSPYWSMYYPYAGYFGSTYYGSYYYRPWYGASFYAYSRPYAGYWYSSPWVYGSYYAAPTCGAGGPGSGCCPSVCTPCGCASGVYGTYGYGCAPY